jgi:hypothetical protein
MGLDPLQIVGDGEKTVATQEAADLERQGKEGREEYEAEGPQEEPSRPKMRLPTAVLAREEPREDRAAP